jgi:hypothetical protein
VLPIQIDALQRMRRFTPHPPNSSIAPLAVVADHKSRSITEIHRRSTNAPNDSLG